MRNHPLIAFSMLALILGYAAYHRITKPEVPFSEVERQAVVTEAARILSERYIWGSDDTSLEGLKKEVEELKNLSRDRALASLLEIQALTPKFKEMLDRSLILAPVSSDTRTIFDYEHKIVKVYRGDSTKEMAMKLAESFAFLFQIEKLRGSELIFVEKNGTTYDTACGTIAECMKRWEQDSPRK